MPTPKKKVALITAGPKIISGVSVFMKLMQEELTKHGYDAQLVYPVETRLSSVAQLGYTLRYAFLKEQLSKFDVVMGNSVGLAGAADLEGVKLIYNAHSNSLGGNLIMRAAFENISPTERHHLNKVLSQVCDVPWRYMTEALAQNRNLFEIDRILAKRADQIIAVAPVVSHNFITHYGVPKKKVKTVMNGIPERWLETRKINPIMDEHPVNVVFTGRAGENPLIIFHKGIDRLLALGGLLKRTNVVAILHSADPVKQEIYRKLMEDHHIQPVFNVDNVQLSHYLRPGDIYVHPSRTEACSLAILEAMASGLAPVAYPIGAVPEFMEDGVNGFIVHSVEEMRARVQELVANPELRARIGKAAQETVRKDFTVAKMVEGYVKVIDKLVEA